MSSVSVTSIAKSSVKQMKRESYYCMPVSVSPQAQVPVTWNSIDIL